MLLSSILSAAIAALIGALTTIIVNWINQLRSYPKINVYAEAVENESSCRYFSLYYSKVYHDYFLIAQLNVDNLSSIDGKLYNVSLSFSNSVNGLHRFYPLSSKQIKDDDILLDYLCTTRFDRSVSFQNEISINGHDKKSICFIFNVCDFANLYMPTTYEFTYCYSGRKRRVEKVPLAVDSDCFTDHTPKQEIIADLSEYRKSNKTEYVKKRQSTYVKKKSKKRR